LIYINDLGDWCRLKKKKKVQENKKELDHYKRQVESLTNKNQHLQRKLQKLKKKIKTLKLKQTLPPMALPLPPPATAEEEQQQQQNQLMYVPVLAGVFSNREQNVATRTVTVPSFHTQKGSASAITSLPATTNGLLLPPPLGGSII
jgi:regulator of replication initiation timing